MANDFINPTTALDKIITEASQGADINTNYEALKYALHQSLTATPQPAQASSMPAPSFACEREIKFAESTGQRTLVIRANSESELDQLESQILYGR